METIILIGSQLGIDSSTLSLFGVLVLMYVVLSNAYVKPHQALLEERKEKTDGVKREAEELTQRADKKFAEYNEKMKALTSEARTIVAQKVDEAKKFESAILAEATAKAKSSLQLAQNAIDEQKHTVIDALKADISALAQEVAAKVLGRSVGTK